MDSEQLGILKKSYYNDSSRQDDVWDNSEKWLQFRKLQLLCDQPKQHEMTFNPYENKGYNGSPLNGQLKVSQSNPCLNLNANKFKLSLRKVKNKEQVPQLTKSSRKNTWRELGSVIRETARDQFDTTQTNLSITQRY